MHNVDPYADISGWEERECLALLKKRQLKERREAMRKAKSETIRKPGKRAVLVIQGSAANG